jgi:hypothetical protein
LVVKDANTRFESEEGFVSYMHEVESYLDNPQEARSIFNIDTTSEIPDIFQPVLNEFNQVVIGNQIFQMDFENRQVLVANYESDIDPFDLNNLKAEDKIVFDMDEDIFGSLESGIRTTEDLVNARSMRCKNIYNFDRSLTYWYTPTSDEIPDIPAYQKTNPIDGNGYHSTIPTKMWTRMDYTKYGIYHRLFTEINIYTWKDVVDLKGKMDWWYFTNSPIIKYDYDFYMESRCKWNRNHFSQNSNGVEVKTIKSINSVEGRYHKRDRVFSSSRTLSSVDATAKYIWSNSPHGALELEHKIKRDRN